MSYFAVTCTGGRPELFELCKKWLARQTVQPDGWVVATDNGDVPPDLPRNATHLRVDPPAFNPTADWRPNHALREAMRFVPEGNHVIVFEDDDWYSPRHAEVCLERLSAGHGVAYCDHVVEFVLPSRIWREHRKPGASEGRVGVHAKDVPIYADRLLNRPLWSGLTDGRYSELTTVGIKGAGHGLPGRPGATPLHRYTPKSGWASDPSFAKFCQLLGRDADDYLRLLSEPS